MQESPLVDRRALALGIAVLGIGVLVTLSKLHLLPPLGFGQLWPLLLIGYGVGKLVAPRPGHRRLSGFVLTFVGAWLLLDTLHLWRLPIDLAWSGALAIGGLVIVIDALVGAVSARGRLS